MNATGPWVDRFLDGSTPVPARRHPRIVKGSHIVVPKLFDHDFAYIFQAPDRRIVFAIPFEGDFTLIGTTERDYEGDLATPAIETAEDGLPARDGEPVFSARHSRAPTCGGPSRGSGRCWPIPRTSRPASPATTCSTWNDRARRSCPSTAASSRPIAGSRRTCSTTWRRASAGRGGTGRRTPPCRAATSAARTSTRFLRDLRAEYARPAGSAGRSPRRRLRHARAAPARRRHDHRGPRRRRSLAGLHEREIDYLRGEEWAVTAEDILYRRSKLALHLPRRRDRAPRRLARAPSAHGLRRPGVGVGSSTRGPTHAPIRARPRPGHDQFAIHPVRPRRQRRRIRAARIHAALPALRLGRARRRGDLGDAGGDDRGSAGAGAGDPGGSRGGRHHEPARDDGAVGPPLRATGGAGDRLAGPAHGGGLRSAQVRRPRARDLAPHRLAARSLLLGHEARVAARRATPRCAPGPSAANSPSARSTAGSPGSSRTARRT